MLVQRLRERPWLLLGAVLIAGAAAQSVVSLATRAPLAETAASTLWIWAAVVAGLSAAMLGRTFRNVPNAAGDTPDPVRVEWLSGFPTTRIVATDAALHASAAGVRLVGSTWTARDTAIVGAAALLTTPLGGAWAATAVAAWAWAVGFPSPQRVALDVAWDDVAAATAVHATRFHLRRRSGGPEIRLEARFSQRQRLTTILAERLGPRFSGPVPARPPGPADPASVVAAAFDADDDAHVGEVVWTRLRSRPLLVAAAVSVLVAVGLHAASFVTGSTLARAGAMAASGAAALLATIGATQLREAWHVDTPRPGDVAAPLAARWTNRPGFPGPREAQVHVLPDALRVVGSEWDPFDLVLVGAAYLVGLSAGGCLGVGAVGALTIALGFPRKRRVAADVAWEDVAEASVAGRSTEIVTRLAAPFDRLRLEVRHSSRERLVAELDQRLGSRFRCDSRVPADAWVAPRGPTPDEIAAQMERLRRASDEVAGPTPPTGGDPANRTA